MTKYAIFFLLLLSCSASAQSVFPLYKDSIPNNLVELHGDRVPTITIYKPPKEKANRKAIIVIPGGAYMFLATSTEGTPIAKAFADSGYTAFVLKYRLPSDQTMRDKSIGPLQDAQQAIKYARLYAAEWNIDTAKVGVIGYSAGGHLASTVGTHFKTSFIPNPEGINLRPSYMILVYPVISMEKPLTHNGSRNSLIGRYPSQLLVDLFSNEKQVTSSTPPTYLTHTADDRVVHVNNSIVFYKALQESNVNVEMHLFPNGNHGFTQKMGVKEWLNPMLKWLRSIGQ
ncbi:MAG: alpha/beta hydrolase [Sediminibacterium sp.]